MDPTPRQLEVLHAVVTYGRAGAAMRLNISERTVKRHLANIRARTGYGDTMQAAWALRRSLEGLAS